jgi:hypothetical protein
MRSIDVCTPKPFNSSTRASSSPGAVTDPGEHLAAPLEDHPRPGALRLRARPRERLFRAHRLACPKTSGEGTGKLGAARCKRGRGEPRFTTRLPLRRPDALTRRRFLPPCGTVEPDRLLTPLSPPLGRRRGSCFERAPRRWPTGRQDRLRGGLVKGVRFTDPGCLPPVVAARNPAEPKPGRTRAALLEDAAFT